MSIRKISARAAALLACAVVLTACNNNDDDSGASDTTPPPSSSAAGTPAADPTTATTAPAAGTGGSVADGTKLKTLLPTAATAPKGWKLDDSAAFDTGATVKSDPGSPLLPDDDCSQALTNGGARTLTSDYGAAYATTGLTDPNDGSSTVVFTSYQPGDAAKQMAEVTALAKRCTSFSSQDASGKKVRMTVTTEPVAGAGDQSLDIRVQPTGNYVGSQIVLVRSGDVIMAVDQSDAAGTMAPLGPVAKQLAAGLPLK
ncbi:hypothetical protein NMG29_33750 [Streptomyces cocklensis]|uniref:PknH-like extracellular domain-containing protein n=1 Tax=Actinacidiphila cocklensis TaxID=887465 RepID=A0A9W4DSS1_9ACTN|nr:hypothetical protein [Actinacidiphila cocklensis]MDD1063098.1 hypothetical protein [Actinacidiphila cocklensis]CAG6395536.1 conserved exported hypothetical protein [Actinacidiphila cocklensis]